MDIHSECVPCRRDAHEHCREALELYGVAVPCDCWVNAHYGLASEPDDDGPDTDAADAAQRRYERALYRQG